MATEKRLIDADDALEQLKQVEKEMNVVTPLGCKAVDIKAVLKYLESRPTVDAVEVIRCKDCKHWKPGDSFSGDSLDDMQRIGRCPIVRFGRREKDFCCDGERKYNG